MPSVQEYDSQHSHPTNPATQQTLSPPPTSSLPSNSIPIPRTAQLASNRPRPQSMPPQTFPSPTTSSVETRDRPSQDDAANASSNPSAAASPSSRRHHREANHAHGQPQSSSSRQRSSNRILGDYTLSKTLGAGSMGKVKLATHNGTGEKLAVKILPRVYPGAPPTTPQDPAAAKQQAAKDASKEIRTLREAALSMLLHHPYICGMREMIIHQHHYYMVFEYVNGGQMLDYIISHGRLRERVARKFARQIGSALDYCHQNNVVHRDLKIENILISQTGNIKIIDFGLSNLYDPIAHLSTFCGSLYFAAPELLNARVYTGPEVDIWSFGVVLYVLVCGKVPFDDQSMPALHAKIKRGLVEYPVWLSADCKSLLSRMLVTNPQLRATLNEVLNHPWMTRGFNGAPDPHLLHREPLHADELDPQVIRNMKGFEFGTDEEIERKLSAILTSDAYIRAVHYWERKRGIGGAILNGTGANRWESLSSSSLAMSQDSGREPNTPSKKSKRFSSFDFYKRKFFSPASASSSPPGTPLGHSPPNSQSQLGHGDVNREPMDPTRSFHPLVAMYYLAREKLEREKVYGPGHFASSQVSLAEVNPTTTNGSLGTVTIQAHAAPASHPPSAYSPVKGSQRSVPPPLLPSKEQPAPPVIAIPSPTTTLTPATVKADYSMPLPKLPAPDQSHYSKMGYDNTVATPSPTSQNFPGMGHPQPRARDAGDGAGQGEQTQAGGQHVVVGGTVKPTKGLPKIPPNTAHRRSHSLSQKVSNTAMGVPGSVLGGKWGGMFGGHGQQQQQQQAQGAASPVQGQQVLEVDEHGRQTTTKSAGPEVLTFAERESRHTPSSPTTITSTGATFVRKFGSLLGGRHDGEHHRRVSTPPPATLTKRASMVVEKSASPRPSAVSGTTYVEDEKAAAAVPAPAAIAPSNSSGTPTPTEAGAGTVTGKGTLSPPPAVRTISHSVSQPLSSIHTSALSSVTASSSRQDSPSVSISSPSPVPVPTSPQLSSSAPPPSSAAAAVAAHRRAATVLDPQSKSKYQHHERRSSTGAALLGGLQAAAATAAGTIGRHRRPSTGFGNSGSGRPFAGGLFSGSASAGEELKEEEEDKEMEKDSNAAGAVSGAGTLGVPTTRRERERGTEGAITDGEQTEDERSGEKEYKPVFLKGLFSVATTSTKPPAIIKADIRRVLDRMQIQYRENKTGYECLHMPSIDISSIVAEHGSGHPLALATSHSFGMGAMGTIRQQQVANGAGGGDNEKVSGHRQSIVKKTSKLSFGKKRDGGGTIKGKDRERDASVAGHAADATTTTMMSTTTATSNGGGSVNGHGAATTNGNMANAMNGNGGETPVGRPSVATTASTTLGATPSSGSSTFFGSASGGTNNALTNGADVPSVVEGAAAATTGESQEQQRPARTPSVHSHTPSIVSAKSKILPPIPRDFGGSGTTAATVVAPVARAPSMTSANGGATIQRSANGSPMPGAGGTPGAGMAAAGMGGEVTANGNGALGVRFEINIVKVPWLPLHGIQFRRTSGDGWQYQMLARRVLTELKL